MNIKRTLLFGMILSLLWLTTSAWITAAPQVKTYLVNSDTDAADASPGDGVCATIGGNCTLHAAIQEANLDGQESTIRFASKFQATHAIYGCSLPALTAPNTTIDGSGGSCVLLLVNSSSNTILGILLAGGKQPSRSFTLQS
jgi:hypothetical protein